MGYHVYLVSRNNKPFKQGDIIRAFNKFNIVQLNDENVYYHTEDSGFAIFNTNEEYWINTTNDEHINYLVKISNYLGNSMVVGEEGEVYIEGNIIYPSRKENLKDKIKYFLYRNISLLILMLIGGICAFIMILAK